MKELKNKIKVLELFSGIKSFSKQLDKRKYEVISLDILPKFKPDIITNILEWDYTNLKFKPDIIWSSPPCIEYSHAKRRGVRNLELADKIVKKTLEIIKYFKPKIWFMENPQTGLLKKRDFMINLNLPYVDVSYCQYGYPYRKQTRIWTNLNNWHGKTCNKKTCLMVQNGKHIGSAGNGRTKYTFKLFNQTDKYSIPPKLIKEIILKIEETIK